MKLYFRMTSFEYFTERIHFRSLELDSFFVSQRCYQPMDFQFGSDLREYFDCIIDCSALRFRPSLDTVEKIKPNLFQTSFKL